TIAAAMAAMIQPVMSGLLDSGARVFRRTPLRQAGSARKSPAGAAARACLRHPKKAACRASATDPAMRPPVGWVEGRDRTFVRSRTDTHRRHRKLLWHHDGYRCQIGRRSDLAPQPILRAIIVALLSASAAPAMALDDWATVLAKAKQEGTVVVHGGPGR